MEGKEEGKGRRRGRGKGGGDERGKDRREREEKKFQGEDFTSFWLTIEHAVTLIIPLDWYPVNQMLGHHQNDGSLHCTRLLCDH